MNKDNYYDDMFEFTSIEKLVTLKQRLKPALGIPHMRMQHNMLICDICHKEIRHYSSGCLRWTEYEDGSISRIKLCHEAEAVSTDKPGLHTLPLYRLFHFNYQDYIEFLRSVATQHEDNKKYIDEILHRVE